MTDNEEKELKQEPTSDYEFLQEKIKERPIDKKKLMQRTIVTASLALLFGIIACFTFLLLQPVLNNWLYPEEEPELVTFPQEEVEMLPEDMLTEEDLVIKQETVEEEESSHEAEPETETVFETQGLPTDNIVSESLEEEIDPYYLINDQISLYQQLYAKYQEVATSMVTVTAVKKDVDWFNNTYQSKGTTAGVIVANNNRYLLILTQKKPLDDADQIQVTFCNKVSAEGIIKCYDNETNLAIIAVEIKAIRSTVMDYVTIAKLGSSVASSLAGTPIIAIGNIQGYKDNVCYGIITSVGNTLSMQDAQYKMITTDIYGSETPSGIIVNMNGQIIGIIDNTYNNKEIKNMVSAVGITELKGMIANLSNGRETAHMGLYVKDITSQIRSELGLPQGAYVFDMVMDSKAMDAGIQKGDIVVRIGDKEVRSAAEYTSAIRDYVPGDEVKVAVKRASQEEYIEMEFITTLEEQK